MDEQKNEIALPPGTGKTITLENVRVTFPNLPKGTPDALAPGSFRVEGRMEVAEDHIATFEKTSIQMIADLAHCSYAHVAAKLGEIREEIEISEFIEQLKNEKLPNGLPRRLSSNNDHPWYNADVIKRVGVKFNGIERKGDVAEYDVDAGYIRVHIRDNKGNWKRSRGRFITIKLTGAVEPYWRS